MNLDIFLKNRNLEAVDEENAAKRRIQEYMRQQVKILNQEVSNEQQLSDSEKDEFNKVYLSFMATLDDYVNKIEGDLDSIKNVGVLTYRYNLLSNVLSKINYQVLDQQQKTPLTTMLDDLIPKLEELQRYASVNNFTDQTQINNMLRGFQSHTFPLLKVSPIVLKEIIPKIDDTNYQANLKIITDYKPSIIKNKQYLSKSEQKIFDNNEIAVNQLERNIKVEGKVTTDSLAKIAKFAKLYIDYKQTIDDRIENIIDLKDSLSNLLRLPPKTIQQRLITKARELSNQLNLTSDYNPQLIKEIQKFLSLKSVTEGLFTIQEMDAEATPIREEAPRIPTLTVPPTDEAVAMDEMADAFADRVYGGPRADFVPEIKPADPFGLEPTITPTTMSAAYEAVAPILAAAPVDISEVNKDAVDLDVAKLALKVDKAPDSKKEAVAKEGEAIIRRDLEASGVSKDDVDTLVASAVAKSDAMSSEELERYAEVKASLDKVKFNTRNIEEERNTREVFRRAYDDKIREGLTATDAFIEAKQIIENELEDFHKRQDEAKASGVSRTTISDTLRTQVLAIQKDIDDTMKNSKEPGKVEAVVRKYKSPEIEITKSVSTYKSLLDRYLELLLSRPDQIPIINDLIATNAPISSFKNAGLSGKNAELLKELKVPINSIFDI